MQFEFKIRGMTKQNKKELRFKYQRAFKKKNKDMLELICALFLDLIYFYFDNPKEKLYKLFFPVIMANCMEKGSIHSVTEEYRNSKNLFSWSYTCRTLKELDPDIGLEISKIFREILFKILKNNGFKNKGYIVAIDITAKPFYGNKNLFMVKGCKRKAGTNYAIQYLTASIVEEGVRFNLLCFPIPSLCPFEKMFNEFVNEISRFIPCKIFFLDRGFGNKKYSKILKFLGHDFVMPITKNPKLKELELSIKTQSNPWKDEYDIIKMDYIFSENKPEEYQVEVRLVVINENGKIYYFITNITGLSMGNYYSLIQTYKYRFGIETNYRVDNIFSPFTSSIYASTRYLLMQVSLIMQDLWTLVNFLTHDEKYRQPREKFKGNYSAIAIAKARTKELGFIWRPVISAIQFKRRIERILT
ncbi:MAG: hypothetical protein ABIE43_03710 [Patescibacteria group bacterium]